jgi:hypothetical protein
METIPRLRVEVGLLPTQERRRAPLVQMMVPSVVPPPPQVLQHQIQQRQISSFFNRTIYPITGQMRPFIPPKTLRM